MLYTYVELGENYNTIDLVTFLCDGEVGLLSNSACSSICLSLTKSISPTGQRKNTWRKFNAQ